MDVNFKNMHENAFSQCTCSTITVRVDDNLNLHINSPGGGIPANRHQVTLKSVQASGRGGVQKSGDPDNFSVVFQHCIVDTLT